MKLLVAMGLASMLFVVWFTWRAYHGPDSGHGQSRKESIIEAWSNICAGFALNYTFNLILLPLMTDGGHLSLSNNFWGGWCFTALSIARQFLLRRAFNSRGFAAWLAKRL